MRRARLLPPLLAMALLIGMFPVAPITAEEPATGAGCAVQTTAYQPRPNEAATALEQAGASRLGAEYPALPALRVGLPPNERTVPGVVPCVLLKAIGYIESGWRQTIAGTPDGTAGPALATSGCSYGMMQITWGMRKPGDLPAGTQQRIAADYRFNALWAGTMLANWWNTPAATLPLIGDRDPNVIENWYYAVWAYNKWTPANNPNNPDLPWPRPAYTGVQSKTNYPYQELIWGMAANPPRRLGQPLWEAVLLRLPRREDVGLTPQTLPVLPDAHRSACAAPPPASGTPAAAPTVAAPAPAAPTAAPLPAAPPVWRVMFPWVTRSFRR